jgi:hypothetical protein
MPTPRFEFGIAAGPGTFYAMGGNNGGFLATNEQGAVTGARIYVLGGSTSYSNQTPPYLNTAESYDPVSDTWSAETTLPTGRRELAAASFVQAGASPVPAMDGIGLAIFMLAAGIGSLYFMKRRKVKG